MLKAARLLFSLKSGCCSPWAGGIRTLVCRSQVLCLYRLATAKSIRYKKSSSCSRKRIRVSRGIRTLGLQSHNLRDNQLRHTHHQYFLLGFCLMSLKGFEPPTHGLEGRCSIQLSYRLIRQRLPHQRGISYHRAFRNASTFFNFFQINFQYLFTPFSDCFFHPIRS